MAITNPTLADYAFLKEMFDDSYFPVALVERGADLLRGLCSQIEEVRPTDTEGVLCLTHATTEAFNSLATEFEEQGSEIETSARECIAADFDFLLKAYGYEIDIEDAIAPREW